MGSAEINGEGVRLRVYRPEDAEALAAGFSDPLCQRFMPPLPSPFTLRHAERFIAERVGAIFADGGAVYAIADPETDDLLGGAGLDKVVPDRGQAEIGYWVAPWARHRGYAAEAAGALAEWALSRGAPRVHLLADVANVPSQRVAERAGFSREGVLRSCLGYRDRARADAVLFGRVRGE